MNIEQLKAIQAEKRRLTIGQICDQLISGQLRRELCMSKAEFSEYIGVRRHTVARIEGLESTPSMKTILNTSAVFRFGVDFPDCGVIEVTPRRTKKKDVKQ